MSKKSLNNKRLFMDTIQNHKNKPLFEVPESYFGQLQHDVMQRITQDGKQTYISKKWFSAISVAASIALIFLLSYFLFVNKNLDEHFYVHQEILPPEDEMNVYDSIHLAEAGEVFVNELLEANRDTETFLSNAPSVAGVDKETIVYSAVDFYVDENVTSNFCEVMYDLECYFDY
jgi:hypothetical protein